MHKNEGGFLLKTKTKNKIKLASWNYTEENKKRQNIGLMVAINLAQLKIELCCEKKKNRETNTTHATTNCHSQKLICLLIIYVYPGEVKERKLRRGC